MAVKVRWRPKRRLIAFYAFVLLFTWVMTSWGWTVVDAAFLATVLLLLMRPRWVWTPKLAPPELTKADMIRLSVDADMPWLDYDSGEIWPVERCREWLEREERKARLRADLERLTMIAYRSDIALHDRVYKTMREIRSQLNALGDQS